MLKLVCYVRVTFEHLSSYSKKYVESSVDVENSPKVKMYAGLYSMTTDHFKERQTTLNKMCFNLGVHVLIYL